MPAHRLLLPAFVAILSLSCGDGPAAPDPANVTAPGGFGTISRAAGSIPDLAECLSGAPGVSCFSARALGIALDAAAAPGIPLNLAASAAGSAVTLTWTAPSSGDPARSYAIEAGSTPGAADLASFSTGNALTSFSAAGVPGGVYYVRVRAENDGGRSAPSNEATLTVGGGPCAVPGAPGALSIVSNSGGTVVFVWNAASGGAVSYFIEAGSASGQSNLANSDLGATTTLTATGVAEGTYYVRVRARNGCGASNASNQVVLTVSLTSSPADAPPVLSVPIVDLAGSYDQVTKRLGALNCMFTFGNDPNDRWCFNAFGSSVVPGKQSVSYDYKVAAGATVFAAAAGTVFRIEAETSSLYPNEFEVETRSTQGGSYSVIYDHVKNLTVGMGSAVQPGVALGTAGIHTTNPGVWGRVELQINRITQRTPRIQSISICPRQFGTDRFNQLNDAALAAHNSANAPYAQPSVCIAETIP